MRVFSLSIALVLWGSSLLHAGYSPPELIRLFSNHFHSQYRAGRCAENIRALLSHAHAQGLDLSQSQVVHIQNEGFSGFGMVNAEKARESGARISDLHSRNRYEAGEANWYYHVILLHRDLVLDFDFTNSPRILPVKEYFEEMFLREGSSDSIIQMNIGRQTKLDDYWLQVTSAEESLVESKGRRVRLKDFLAKIR